MKTIQTAAARNIINTDFLNEWLTNLADESYPALKEWILGPCRKHIIKTGKATPVDLGASSNLPEWLRKSMAEGIPAEALVLDDDLRNTLVPVLDYMNELKAQKPDTQLNQIGFEVAQKRSEKWHADMAKKSAKLTVIPEDGSEIVKTYDDGWTWRKLVGKPALEREGEIMGHCVGGFGYYEMSLRARVDIFSLRDPENLPHVTVEANMAKKTIQQIKGKANKEVLPKYLPRVADWIDDHTWNSINYDGARSIATDIQKSQIVKVGAVFKWGGYAMFRLPRVSRSGDPLYSIYADTDVDHVLDLAYLAIAKTYIESYNVIEQDAQMYEFIAHLIVAHKLEAQVSVGFLLNHVPVLQRPNSWQPLPQDIWGQALAQAHGVPGASMIYTSKSSRPIFSFYCAPALFLDNTESFARQVEMVADFAPEVDIVYNCDFLTTNARTKNIELTERVTRRQSGKKVVTDTDETLANSLFEALKQPGLADIKAGYMRLKSHSRIADADFKALGFATGGRAINGIATVMLCTLPVNNKAPFRSYVFNKPNLCTCWSEVLTQPDHLLNSLSSYGLSAQQIDQIVSLLRNEFLRLVPDESELAEMELDGGALMRVNKVIGWARGHKQDHARSKRIWSQV